MELKKVQIFFFKLFRNLDDNNKKTHLEILELKDYLKKELYEGRYLLKAAFNFINKNVNSLTIGSVLLYGECI